MFNVIFRREMRKSDTAIMSNEQFEIVIPVRNLDSCRAFYRGLLGLGNPVFDSNFQVEFQLDNRATLILQKITDGQDGQAKVPEWQFRVEKPEELSKLLKSYGIRIEALNRRNTFRCLDPENNPFIILNQTDA